MRANIKDPSEIAVKMTPKQKKINQFCVGALCFIFFLTPIMYLTSYMGLSIQEIARIDGVGVNLLALAMGFSLMFAFIAWGVSEILGLVGKKWASMPSSECESVLAVLKAYPDFSSVMDRIAVLDRKLYQAEAEYILSYHEGVKLQKKLEIEKKHCKALYGI